MSARRSPLLSSPAWAGLLLLLLAGLLYAATLDNGFRYGELDGGDLITHQFAQVQARPGNAPGYPVYTMGGWLWFHTLRPALRALGGAMPNPIPILSSYSTLWALLALWLLYRSARFVTSTRYRPESAWGDVGNWPLAWLIAAFYAVTYFFWFYATTSEQYTSAIAQTLAILYLYLLWSEADAQQVDYSVRSRPGALLIAPALLCGLSLAHMLTVALIVPPLVAAVLWQRPALLRRGRLMAAVIAAALAPLLAYLYVYLRGAQHPEWWGSMDFADAGEWFWFFVSTSQGRDELGWGFEAGATLFANGFPELIWQELGILLPVGLVGVGLMRRRERLLLFGTLALYLIFCWAYRYGNWFQVILPAYPLVLVGAAVLIDRVQAARPFSHSPWLRAAPSIALALLVGWRAAASLPRADNRNRAEDVALDAAALLLERVPARAALFAPVAESVALNYLISIWGLKPDAIVVPIDKINDAVEEGRPLLVPWTYLPRLLSEVNGAGAPPVAAYDPDWAQVQPGAPKVAPPATRLDQELLDGVVLEGYTLSPSPTGSPVVEGPPGADLLLTWRLREGRWPEGLSISVRALSGDDYVRNAAGEMAQQDAVAPLRGFLPMAGGVERIADPYRLPLVEPLPAGADGFELILYDASGPVATTRIRFAP